MYFTDPLSCFNYKPLTAMTNLCMTGFVVMAEATVHPVLIYCNEFPPDYNVLDISNGSHQDKQYVYYFPTCSSYRYMPCMLQGSEINQL